MVKVADFGLAKLFNGKKMKQVRDRKLLMQTACGSRLYAAPEVLEKHKYGSSVDMWGLGIIL